MTPKQNRQSKSTPPVSSSLSSYGIGTAPNETTSTVVIGADTLVTPTASAQPEKPANETVKLTDDEYGTLPRFTIRSVSCCGLMEVSGIQGYMKESSEGLEAQLKRVTLGLYSSLIRQLELYNTYQKNYNVAHDAYAKSQNPENNSRFIHAQLARDQAVVIYKMGLAGQFIFTYTEGHSDAFFKAFGEYVKKNCLGEVYIAPKTFYNPNSTRQVRTVLFNVDNKGYSAFVRLYTTKEQTKLLPLRG